MKKSVLNQALSKSLRSKYIGTGGAFRFRSFQTWLLDADLPADLHVFLALFAFDGMRVQDFGAAIKSKPALYTPEKIGLSWSDPVGRVQRLSLSAMTIFLLRKTSWDKVHNFSTKALEEVYGNFSGHVKTLDHFSADQLAWFSEISSGPLFEHFCGRIPMTALSDECYVRFSTKQAIFMEDLHSIEKEESERILSIALSGFLEPVGEDKNPLLIDRLLQICHRKRIDDASKQKYSMLQQCFSLAEESADFGAVSSLILSWAIDLIGHGTGNKSNISVSTIVSYVGVLSRPLFQALKQQDVIEWDVAKFETLYEKLIQEVSAGQRRSMASAINSWHRFLVNWLDIPPIYKRLHDEVMESPPLANIVWENEYRLLQEWLTGAKMDQRLVMYLQAIFCVAYHIRIRINELLKLRLVDIRIFAGSAEITIRGTKSIAAKRRVEVSSILVIELITLLERRLSESALPDDLLFADPNKINRIYQLSKLYTFSNQLLKAATGDRSIRFHVMSHTVITQSVSEILAGGTASLTNPLHQCATDVAHYSIITSCSEYVHCYEDAIRLTIDRGLQDLEMTSKVVSKWTGCRPEAIRQRVFRSGIRKNTCYWKIVLGSINFTGVSLLSDDYQVILAEIPKFLSEGNRIDFTKILNIFCDLSKSVALETIALRQSLDVKNIKLFLLHAKSVILKGRLDKRINFNSTMREVEIAINELTGVDFRKVNQKKLDEIFKWFKRNQLSDEMLKAATSWLMLQKSGYISLPPDSKSRNLIYVLSKIGLPITHVAIAHSTCTNQNDLIILQSIFYETYGATVPQFNVEQRRGRPNIYLLFSSTRVRAGVMPKPASSSISGLNGLLFIMMVMMEGGIVDGQ